MSHPVENIMKSTMEQLREMVDVNTIVGAPILSGDDTMVLPVSKVSLGFLSGGGEYQQPKPVKNAGAALGNGDDERYPFAGTAVAGLSITPMAFVAVNGLGVRVYPAQRNNSIERVIDMIPGSIAAIERMTAKQENRPDNAEEAPEQ